MKEKNLKIKEHKNKVRTPKFKSKKSHVNNNRYLLIFFYYFNEGLFRVCLKIFKELLGCKNYDSNDTSLWKSKNISLWTKKLVKMNEHKKLSKRQKLKIRQIIAREQNWKIESWSWIFLNHGWKENWWEIRTGSGNNIAKYISYKKFELIYLSF